MRLKLSYEDMSDLARGASFLGCGGGGDPYLGRLLCENAIREYGMPEVIALDELADDANVYVVGIIGAPTVMIEKLFSVEDFELALSQLETFTGRPADAIVSAEAGGFNGLLPIALAARRGIPVLNADGVGRAVPEAHQTTYNAYGVSISPMAIANEHGETVVMRARDGASGERLARAMTIEMGLSVVMACYPMTGVQAKRAAVPDVLSISLGIGRAIREGRRTGDPLGTLFENLRSTKSHRYCTVLFEGKIADVQRETSAKGWTFAKYRLAALNDPSSSVEIMVQNENLLARRDGELIAMVPDLIVLVDAETAEPITTETVRHGQRAKLLGISVGEMLRTPQALQWFGPRAFGLECDYVPIEEMTARS